MKNILSGLLIFFVMTLPFIGLQPVYAANLAPDFKLQDTNLNTISLNSYKGKQAVLLFFWTSWCPYCRTELKALNERFSQLKKENNIEVLAINAGESLAQVKSFIKSYFKSESLPYPVLTDISTSVVSAYGVIGVPTYILINKNGLIVFEGHSFPARYKELIQK